MNKKRYFQVTVFTALALTMQIALATTPSSKKLNGLKKPRAPYGHITFQLGGFIASQGAAQHIDINTMIGEDFSVEHQNNSNGLVGIAFYHDGKERRYANLSYGINAFYLAPNPVDGLVTQENTITELSYNYFITNWPIYFAVKALSKNRASDKYQATFDLGIGPNIIQASHLNEHSLNGITQPEQLFTNKTSVAFSAMTGVGLRINRVFGPSPLECGYRFFYLGQGNYNIINNQVKNALNTGNSYANALLCALTIE